MRTTKTLLIIIISFFPFFLFSTVAADADSNEIPFQVYPLIPEGQTENKGYFEFEVADNFYKTFYIQARNLKSSRITLLITPINASTSSYGQISYNVNVKSSQFINLKVPLSQFITYEKKITIPANSTVDIPFQIQLNHVENGMVLGGIHVIAEDETVSENEVKQGKATFQIKNQIAYVIGVKLQTPELVDPEFSFGSVEVDMQYRKPRIFIEMKNSAPAVVKDLSGTYSVTDKDGNQVVEGTFSKMKMAPNTRFEYAVDWMDGKIDAGKYRIKLSAEADGEKVSAQKTFIIKDTNPVTEYNQKAEETEGESAAEDDSSFPWWSYVATAAIAGLFFFIIGKKSNRKREQ